MQTTITIDNPATAIKLSVKQAKELGINLNEENVLKIEQFGPWQIVSSCEGLCVSKTFSKEQGYTEITQVVIYGKRKLSNPKQGSYELEGYVSIKGKKYSAFTSSQLFEIEGKTLQVGVIHARVRTN